MAALWTFAPDWGGDGITETLEWLTDVLTSPAGVEQGRSLRRFPRRSWSGTFIVEDRERRLLDLRLHRHGGGDWHIPVWPDVSRLPTLLPAGALKIALDTRWLDYVAGGTALLRGDTAFDAERVTVAAVADDALTLAAPTARDWPAGTRIYPMRAARLGDQPEITRVTDRAETYAATFTAMEGCAWDAWTPEDLYRGRPVLAERPDETEDLTAAWERLLLSLDNDVGLPQSLDTAGQAFAVRRHRWVVTGRADRARLRGLVYGLRGRQGRVWIPTHAEDVAVGADIAAGDRAVTVARGGFAEAALDTPGRRDLRIEHHDGRAWHRRILSAATGGGEEETLILDAPITDPARLTEDGRVRLTEDGVPRHVAETGYDLGVALPATALRRVSFMALSRLAGDAVEIVHHADSHGLATCAVTFRGTYEPITEE